MDGKGEEIDTGNPKEEPPVRTLEQLLASMNNPDKSKWKSFTYVKGETLSQLLAIVEESEAEDERGNSAEINLPVSDGSPD